MTKNQVGPSNLLLWVLTSDLDHSTEGPLTQQLPLDDDKLPVIVLC